MFLPANTAPIWTYWMWGIMGLALFYYGIKGLRETHGQGPGWFIGYSGMSVFGLFLLYYWAARVFY